MSHPDRDTDQCPRCKRELPDGWEHREVVGDPQCWEICIELGFDSEGRKVGLLRVRA